MIWDCEQTIQGNIRTILPCSFTSRILAIDITAANQKSGWYRSGFLRTFVTIDGQQFVSTDIETKFGQQIIEVSLQNYQVEFTPRVWLNSTTIKIKQLSPTEISSNFMPNYGPMPTSIGEQPVLDSLPTSFNAPQYLVATAASAYQCLPANAARQTFAVTNTGAAPVFLDLDAPTAVNKRFVTVAVNGTYVSDFPYVGAVFIWSTNASAQPCEIREFIQ